MAYSKEVRKEIEDRLKRGEKTREISEQMKVSLSTINRWKKEWIMTNKDEKKAEESTNNEIIEDIQEEIEASKEIKQLIRVKKFDEAFILTERYPNNLVIQSQRIKILIKERRYLEAKEIGNREEFINHAPIQSQMITIAIKEGNLEEAKRIGNREEFINYAPIQSQMITIAIKEGNLEEAKRIGNRKEFINNAPIQSQMITIVIREGNLEEAKRIGNREEFINYAPIQSQMITIAIKEGNLEEAKRIGNREEFINYAPIQSQMITIVIREGNLEEAKRIGNRKEFINNPPIQSQIITIAIKEGNLEEAKRIGNREEFINYAPIQSQMITIAIREGNLEEAKRIGNRKDFINNPPIQSQIITIAIKEGNLEEAKRIGNRKEFINDAIIQVQMERIKQMERYFLVEEDDKQINEPKQQYLNQIKTKLYYNQISKEEIEEIRHNSEISEDERIFILLAIYEKQGNEKVVKRLIKKYKEENPRTEHNKTFNIIIHRMESKKAKIFDYGFYDCLLHWEQDEELQKDYEQINQEKNIKETKIEKQKEVKPTNRVQKEKNIQFKHIGLEKTENKFKEKLKVESRKNIVVVQEKKNKKTSHFNEVMEYLIEKRRLIYVKMQSDNYETQRLGIQQWDKMESLLEKVNENKNNEEYLNNLYEKITQLKAKEKGISR